MKYVYEDFVDQEDIASAEGQGFIINVRFCRDCPYFEINGIQPDPNNVHGWCRRLSFEGEGKYTPHYIHVDSNSFCNENHISGVDGYEIL